MGRCRSVLATILSVAVASGAHAAVEVTRGPQTDIYGSCAPTLVVANDSIRTIEYLQVDVVVRFRDGREAKAELKSAYQHGILRPIGPGSKATLKINPDEATPLGAPCSEVETITPVGSICESASGDCSAAVRLESIRR